MIILLNKEGRFAHQLNQFAMLVANACHRRTRFYHRAFRMRYRKVIDLHHPFLEEYMSYADLKIIGYILLYWVMRLFRIPHVKFKNAGYHLRPHRRDELMIGDRLELLDHSRETDIITNFIISDMATLLQYRDTVRSVIQPVPALAEKVNAMSRNLRKEYDILLGVHIRRGDYKDFAGGTYFYDDSVYKNIVDRFLRLVPGKRVAVIICSDELPDRNVFSGTDIFMANRPYQEDFFLLRSCDYLIGPHSFFTLMASYLGDNKLYQLMDPQQPFVLNDFWDIEKTLMRRYHNRRSIDEIS